MEHLLVTITPRPALYNSPCVDMPLNKPSQYTKVSGNKVLFAVNDIFINEIQALQHRWIKCLHC